MKQTTVAIIVVGYLSVMPVSQTWSQVAIVDLESHVWNYMLPLFADPAFTDADFNTTWMLSESQFNVLYDGPSFTNSTRQTNGGSGAGVFGYGPLPRRIDVGLVRPPTRATAYFRTSFVVPTVDDDFLPGSFKFDLLADDGGVVYLDGEPVARLNCCDPNVDQFASTSIGVGDGFFLTDFAIEDLAAGSEHTLAVSVHQFSPTSDDLGFAFQLSAQTGEPQFGTISLGNNNILGTGFEEPIIGATNYARGTNPPGTELGFTATAQGGTRLVNTVGGKQYVVNRGGVDLMTESIDLRQTTGEITVSVDVRAWEVSNTSNFESNDSLRVFVEASNNGVLFTEFDVVPTRTGGFMDDLKSLEVPPGAIETPFTNFSTTIDADEFATLRVVVEGITDSDSEHIAFDNITIRSGSGEFVPCDFDQSGRCDVDDLDVLMYTGLNSDQRRFDLNGDDAVDLGDRDAWLVAAGSLPGDSNLDGINNAIDLNAVGSHWVPNNTGVTSWSDGDFNGDGIVDPTDLNALGRWWSQTAADFSRSAADASPVPEPSETQLVLISLIALYYVRDKCRAKSKL